VTQGVWALVLARYSGSDDVCFGVTMATRPTELPGVENILGLMINKLPLRMRVRADMVCGEWLQKLFQRTTAIHNYDYYPLQRMQSFSDLEPGQALFDISYTFENFPFDASANGTGTSNSAFRRWSMGRTRTESLLLIRSPDTRIGAAR